MTQRFKEGAPMTSSGAAVILMQHAPHPNPAKLFVNWFLSREGQMAWQRQTKNNSLRIDIPKEGLRRETVPIAGQTYVFGSTEEQRQAQERAIAFIRGVIERRGK